MADEAEPAPLTLKQRMAALQLAQVGRFPNGAMPAPSNTNEVNEANGRIQGARPPPPPPPSARPSIPARPQRTNTSNVPPIQDNGISSNRDVANLPAETKARPALPPRTSTQSSQGSPAPSLPPRRPSEQPSPALPPRRPSESPSQRDYDRSRRGSTDSTSSVATTRSSISAMSTAPSTTSQGERYRIRAPEYDQSSLPALPPKRTKEEREAADRRYAGLRPMRRASTPKVGAIQNGTTPPPAAPPALPIRTFPAHEQQLAIEPPPPSRDIAPARQPVAPPPLPGRSAQAREQPTPVEPPPRINRAEIALPPRERPSALSFGMNKSTSLPPPLPGARPGPAVQVDGASHSTPPPIPTMSKPDLAALQASKPKMNTAASTPGPASAAACMHCRDFSGPDNHAARFPRESLPSQDLNWLANQLCAPFPSPTDKARALFTWQHHNIAYDTEAFFANNVKPSTPKSTLASGLAVCEGYAGLFAAMALAAGLQAVVVSGHGKGFGYAPTEPGAPLPRYDANHAWNAVRIDNGEWKLIDCCWGAGSICPHKTPNYTKSFTPEWFCQSNIDFGLRHFPGDNSQQYRTDGRVIGWEEYIRGDGAACTAMIYSGYVAEEGLLKQAFRPSDGKIVLAQQGPTVRFSFQKICPHWDPIKNGRGPYYLYVLMVEGMEDPRRNQIPFDTNGEVWWCDVPTRDLGRPGQGVSISVLTNFDGKDGRGLTKQKFLEKRGRAGWSSGGVARWELA